MHERWPPIYTVIGLAVCSFQHSFHWGLVLVSLAAIVLARGANIYGLSALINTWTARSAARGPPDRRAGRRGSPALLLLRRR